MSRVALIGLGRMGSALARRFASVPDVDLVLYNRTSDRALALAAELGVETAGTPAEAATGAEFIVTMLSDGAALRDVYEGPAGVLATMASGSVAIDMSTIGRASALRANRKVAAAGSDFLEAPVSGTPDVAAAGELTVMAGGTTRALRRASPILRHAARHVIHVGGVGHAAAMKLAHNTAIYGLNQALAEALRLADRSGIARSIALDAFSRSSISGPFLVGRRHQFADAKNDSHLFTISLAIKDLNLALELAREVGVELPQSTLNRALLLRAQEAGLGQRDISAMSFSDNTGA